VEKNDYYKYMFLIAAFWNWLVGVTFILTSILAPDAISIFGVANPPSFMWMHIVFALIILFGCFFFATSRNLQKYHGIAIFYILEKSIFLVISLIYLIIGHINLLGFMPTAVDTVFGCLFIEFLLKYEA